MFLFLVDISIAIVVNSTQFTVVQQLLAVSSFNFTLFNTSNCPLETVPVNASIACNSLGRITQLYLSGMQIRGVLNASLAQLTDLTYINISSNHLFGSIQPFYSLTKLTTLDISNNGFAQGDAIGLVESLPALTSCGLQLPFPYNTNCFPGEIWANATLCSNPVENPLLLCITYFPRSTSTTMTSTTLVTSTGTPIVTSTVKSTVLTSTVKTSSLLPTTISTSSPSSPVVQSVSSTTSTLSPTFITSKSTSTSTLPVVIPTTTSTSTSASTSTSESSFFSTKTTSAVAARSTYSSININLVLTITSVLLALAFVLAVSYIAVTKSRKRRSMKQEEGEPYEDDVDANSQVEAPHIYDRIQLSEHGVQPETYSKPPPPHKDDDDDNEDEKSYDAVRLPKANQYDKVTAVRRPPQYDRVDSEITVYAKPENTFVF